MKVYVYDFETFEFVGERDAQESPLEKGVYLIPAYATESKPPKATKNKVAVFENNEWVLKPDYRGEKFEVLGNEVVISDIGVTPESLKPSNEEKAEYEKEKARNEKIAKKFELMQKLRETDYVALPDYDKERPEILTDRQKWREEIRKIETELGIE